MKALKVNYDALPWKPSGEGVSYKPVIVDSVTATKTRFEKGIKRPPHSHDEVQLIFCMEGELDVYVKDSEAERIEKLVAGDALLLQGGVLHGFHALENTLVFAVWSPTTRFAKDAIVLGDVAPE